MVQNEMMPRSAAEMIEVLQCKLCMMGIHNDGTSNMVCDNEAIIRSSTIPESTLKKENVAICYHCVCKACT